MEDTIEKVHSNNANVIMLPPKAKIVNKPKKRMKISTVPHVRKIVKTIKYEPPQNDPGRNNLSLIQRDTKHWKDPAYIAMMHTRISDKLEEFLDDLGVVLMEFHESKECEDDPNFITEVKKLVLQPLKSVLNKITEYNDFVFHALSKDAIGTVLDIGNSKEALNIIILLCKTQTYAGTFTYFYDQNHIEYELFFDDKRYYFQLDKKATE
jgi:hypothetical protein